MSASLRVLALSPYDGGSHAQFLNAWTARSVHQFTTLRLPARHFKWRIRQGSVGLAQQATELVENGATFDIIWTTSMLDAAELRGLLPAPLRTIPLVAYFHENQFVYPVRKEDERNQHFSLINWATALAADETWFNSEFNRSSLLDGLDQLLRKMPDHKSLETVEAIRRRSRVESLGIEFPKRQSKHRGPLHIAWVGRWEHDKRPDLFFAALSRLQERGVEFELTVLGQSFRSWPKEFERAREQFRDSIRHCGFAADRDDYLRLLGPVDVAVSTADHEFFGVALLEAVGTGALPLLPDRLVYPELYSASCLYSGDEGLVVALEQLAKRKASEGTLEKEFDRRALHELVGKYDFSVRAGQLDASLSRCHQQAMQAVG